MSWLVISQCFGLEIPGTSRNDLGIPIQDDVGVPGPPLSKVSRVLKYIPIITVVYVVSLAVVPIGGLVVVGQMIRDYGKYCIAI